MNNTHALTTTTFDLPGYRIVRNFGIVRGIDVRYSPGRLIIEIASDRDKADLELWTGERRTDLLAKLLDRRVILRQ